MYKENNMAQKRLLKKEIVSISDALFAEALFRLLEEPEVDKTKGEQLLCRILRMKEEFVRRAHRSSGNGNKALVKQYYRKLVVDLIAEMQVISKEINELGENKKEQA